MEAILGGVVIFLMRVGDVSLGTLRVLAMVRGNRVQAATLAFFEALIFIGALLTVLTNLHDPWRILGYAMGYASGTASGMTLERWIASGWILTRIITRHSAPELLAVLREHGFGVTAVRGHGREGDVLILFIASPRRRGELLLRLAKETDAKAFITVDPIQRTINGYLPPAIGAAAVRK